MALRACDHSSEDVEVPLQKGTRYSRHEKRNSSSDDENPKPTKKACRFPEEPTSEESSDDESSNHSKKPTLSDFPEVPSLPTSSNGNITRIK